MKVVVKEFQLEYDFEQPVWVRDDKRELKGSKMMKPASAARMRNEPMLENKRSLRGRSRDYTHCSSRHHRTTEQEERGGWRRRYRSGSDGAGNSPM